MGPSHCHEPSAREHFQEEVPSRGQCCVRWYVSSDILVQSIGNKKLGHCWILAARTTASSIGGHTSDVLSRRTANRGQGAVSLTCLSNLSRPHRLFSRRAHRHSLDDTKAQSEAQSALCQCLTDFQAGSMSSAALLPITALRVPRGVGTYTCHHVYRQPSEEGLVSKDARSL